MLSASLASSFETTMLMPTPMLNVLNISRSQISPAFAMRSNIGRTFTAERSIFAPSESGMLLGMFSIEAAARDVGYALDLYLFEQGENGLPYIFVGVSRVSPMLLPPSSSTGKVRLRFSTSKTFLTSEKPFE